MRILLDTLHHSWKWLASVDSESEAHGRGLQYKASRQGSAEWSDTEGAAVIVLASHDGFQYLTNRHPSRAFHASDNQQPSSQQWFWGQKKKNPAH